MNKTKAILYYTDNQINIKLAKTCRSYIQASGLPITSVSLKPLDFGKNIVLYENTEKKIPFKRGKLTMFRQILAGLESMTEQVIFLCEHDVIYSHSHFDFVPEKEDIFYYNSNNWRVRADGHAVKFDHDSTSQLCAYREALIREYRERVRRVELEGFHGNGYEPGTRTIAKGGFSDATSARWSSEYANLDIRHDNNLTPSRWSQDKFRDKSTCANWKESTIWEIPSYENFNLFAKPINMEETQSFFDKLKGSVMNNLNKPTQSPTVEIKVEEVVEQQVLMTFPDALKEVTKGHKIAKLEWKDKEEYGFLNGKFLQIYKDSKFYNWIVSDADLLGEDFYVIK